MSLACRHGFDQPTTHRGAKLRRWGPRVETVSDPVWERRVRVMDRSTLPRAHTTRIESVNAFHGFFPMEVIASDSEAAAFMASAPNGWALVPEHRDYPVRMRRFLPQHWSVRGPVREFTANVLEGEAH